MIHRVFLRRPIKAIAVNSFAVVSRSMGKVIRVWEAFHLQSFI
jgi:hypothetical protein